MASYLTNLKTFDTDVIAKGNAYFNQGRVKVLLFSSDKAQAEVKGRELYRTELTFNPDKTISSCSCTCPEKKPCKHMAALLYHLSNNDSIKPEDNAYYDELERLKSSLKKAKAEPTRTDIIKIANDIVAFDKISEAELIELFPDFLSIPQPYGETEDRVSRAISIYLGNSKIGKNKLEPLFESVLTDKKVPLYNRALMFKACTMDKRARTPFLSTFRSLLMRSGKKINELAYQNISIVYGPDINAFFLLLCAREGFFPISENDYQTALKDALEKQQYVSVLELIDRIANQFDGVWVFDLLKILCDKGFSREARKIGEKVFIKSNDFSSYVGYKKLFNPEEYSRIARKTQEQCRFKPYYGAYCLYENRDDLLSVAFNKLTLNDVFVVKDNLNDKNRVKTIKFFFKRFESLLDTKKNSPELVDGLKFLDYLHDGSLKDYLRDPRLIEKTKDAPELRSLYLNLIRNNDMSKEVGVLPYTL